MSQRKPWSQCEACPLPVGARCISRRHARFCDKAREDRERLERNPDYDPYWLRDIWERGGHPPEPQTTVVLRANHLTSWTGYGQIACEVAHGLERLGVPVTIEAGLIDERYFPLSAWVREHLLEGQSGEPWVVQLAPPDNPPPSGRRSVVASMWESDRISEGAAENLNNAEALIVPTAFNADGFRASGVERPIFVVPMGIDPEIYHDADDFPSSGPFIFGAAGRYAHGGIRKNLDFAARCFVRVADKMPKARLHLKIWNDCVVSGIPKHPRIVLDRRPMSSTEFADWCRSLTVYVNPSRGEGWGMIGHQCMAVGRPMIAVPWSGTVAFWSAPEHGWALDYRLERAGEFYAGHGGRWAVAEEDSLCQAMLYAYRHRDECQAKGKVAARRAAEFTWDRTAGGLRDALVASGMLRGADGPKGAGASGNGQASHQEPALPSWLRQVRNYAGAEAAHLLHGRPKVSEANQQSRMSLCESCTEWFRPSDLRCAHNDCGCYLVQTPLGEPGKTWWADQACPIGRWGTVAAEGIAAPMLTSVAPSVVAAPCGGCGGTQP